MADQTARLEAATVRAEVGSSILYRFSNDGVAEDPIPTASGDITNLKKVILEIQTEGANKISFATQIYPTTAAGIAATTNGAIFLVRSADPDEIYAVYSNNAGTAVDTGKRALSATAIQTATDAATAAATSAQTAANTATARVAGFHSPAATDPLTRDDGSALQIGDTYFNTTTQSGRTYASSGWVLSSVSGTDLNTAINTREPLITPGSAGQFYAADKTFKSVGKADVGLGNVDNTTDANKPISISQQNALNLKAPINSPTFTGTVSGITKSMVGLANVDNTSDANKPLSTATVSALSSKADYAYASQNVPSKLAETPSVQDYGSVAAAEAAVAVSGGTLKYPAGSYSTDPAQTVGNVLREYFGPNSPASSYSAGDNLAVGARVFKYSDGTNHIGKEGYTVFVESRPKGSTDGSVPGSDFAIGGSIVKQNWQSSAIEGQVCGHNTVTRGGYFKQSRTITSITKANPAVVTTSAAHGFVNGNTVIIQNVVGMGQVNGYRKYTVAGATSTTFQLSGVDSTSYGTYGGGGIAFLDSGVVSFYNPGDTAAYIANTVQASAGAFSAILEGFAAFFPSGSFNAESIGIRVQLGAIKKAENLAIGVLAVASNGSCGAAFQCQNSRADVGIEGTWSKAFSYYTDFGAGAYEAFMINQLGNLVLNGGTAATTPKKLIRANSTNGALEVVNDANTAVLFSVPDNGAVSAFTSYAILGTKVVGARSTGWNAMNGTADKVAVLDTSTVTLPQLAQRVKALQDALMANTGHGLIG